MSSRVTPWANPKMIVFALFMAALVFQGKTRFGLDCWIFVSGMPIPVLLDVRFMTKLLPCLRLLSWHSWLNSCTNLLIFKHYCSSTSLALHLSPLGLFLSPLWVWLSGLSLGLGNPPPLIMSLLQLFPLYLWLYLLPPQPLLHLSPLYLCERQSLLDFTHGRFSHYVKDLG